MKRFTTLGVPVAAILSLLLSLGTAFAADAGPAPVQPLARSAAPPAARAAAPDIFDRPKIEPRTPKELFEQAWWDVCDIQRRTSLTRDEQHAARLKTIAYARRAYQEAPQNARYAESLAYMYLLEEAYPLAERYYGEALKLNPKEPRLPLMKAMTSAAVIISKAKRSDADVKLTMDGYRQAAEADKDNALPYLLAANVAFTLNRPDLAKGMIEKALEQPELRLLYLPIPHVVPPRDKADAAKPCPYDGYVHDSEPLIPGDNSSSTLVWYVGQHTLWRDFRSAFSAVVGNCIQVGRQEEDKKSLVSAFTWYRYAGRVGKEVAYAEPLLFGVSMDALNELESAYTAQEPVLRSLGHSAEAEETKTEVGVMAMAQMVGDNNKGQYAMLLTGKRAGVRLESGGKGYTAPTIAFAGGGATTQASATATVVNGVITGITLTSPGVGYTSAPTVTISDATGKGAVAVATFARQYQTWEELSKLEAEACRIYRQWTGPKEREPAPLTPAMLSTPAAKPAPKAASSAKPKPKPGK